MPIVGVKWYHDWSPNPPICAGIEAVPTIYNAAQAGKPVGGNSTYVMWFNEPDQEGQDNYLSPSQAAELWNNNIGAYPGKKHVSPGVINVTWLRDFLPLTNRKPDALSVHIYEWDTLDVALLRAKMVLSDTLTLAQQYGINEIWVTEWAGLPAWMGVDASLLFERRMLTEVFPQFPQVTRQAWFQLSYRGDEPWAWGQNCNTSLVDYFAGTVTPFGQVYKEVAGGATINPNWDERADIVPDGEIDIKDLALVAGKFGQKKYT
jgi:hypothetical protein